MEICVPLLICHGPLRRWAETRLVIWDLFQLRHCLGMSLNLPMLSGWKAFQNSLQQLDALHVPLVFFAGDE